MGIMTRQLNKHDIVIPKCVKRIIYAPPPLPPPRSGLPFLLLFLLPVISSGELLRRPVSALGLALHASHHLLERILGESATAESR